MKSLLNNFIVVAGFALLANPASAGLIDFSHVDSFVSGGRIEKIADVSFSYDVKSHPDAFYHLPSGSGSKTDAYAHNWYGESDMYFTFDNAVQFTSIDIGYSCCRAPETMSILLFDINDSLLASQTFNWVDDWTTYTFNQNNVSKVEFEFTGGYDAYHDGRLHAWYGIDNIKYEANLTTSVSEPGSLILLGLGLAGLGLSRRNAEK